MQIRSEIVSDHRERMINLRKYYPFFKLTESSFSQYQEGKYDMLDMGYLLMAILRFFIEENNFKEKDVRYEEYVTFITGILIQDFSVRCTQEEYESLARYIFDKIENGGKPFEFSYFDPVEKKKKVSRVRILESTIRDNTVWYTISSDAVEFYLDTKEIQEESKISVQQLLLEKMIRAQNFKGGVEVIARINEEVSRLQRKKNEVTAALASDVFSGIDAYEEFVHTGMRWFSEEDKLFKKNRELIEMALRKLEESRQGANAISTEGYYKTLQEIYALENQLKQATRHHGELLKACTDMQKLTDDAVRRAKLGRLKSHMDFGAALSDMVRTDHAELLEGFIKPLLLPKTKKLFNVVSVEDALTIKPLQYEEVEKVSAQELQEIVFDDEVEDYRIRDNYIFLMNNFIQALKQKNRCTLEEFHTAMKKTYGDRIAYNGDYFSFFVNLCQNPFYCIGKEHEENNSFLDAILQQAYEQGRLEPITFSIERNQEHIVSIGAAGELMDVCFIRTE